MNYKKIRITGASGSGKSYLGKKLAGLFSYSYASIDDFSYDFSETTRFVKKRPFSERKKLIKEFLKNDSWVLDGSYYTLARNTYDEADMIVFLRVSFIKRFFNVWKRWFRRMFSGKYEGFLPFMSLLNYNIKSRKKWGSREKEIRDVYKGKFRSFSSADEAYEWFSLLSKQ